MALLDHRTRHRAREMRSELSDAERKLWRVLRESFPDLKFRRQHPVPPYFADIACVSAHLIIEVDGGQHAENAQDDVRTRHLEALGWRVIRFWNDQVLREIDGVILAVDVALKTPTPTLPRVPAGEGALR